MRSVNRAFVLLHLIVVTLLLVWAGTPDVPHWLKPMVNLPEGLKAVAPSAAALFRLLEGRKGQNLPVHVVKELPPTHQVVTMPSAWTASAISMKYAATLPGMTLVRRKPLTSVLGNVLAVNSVN